MMMKRYYFKKNDKEIERLKRDLFYYARVMSLDFTSDEGNDGWVCELRRAKDSHRCVAFVIRNSLSQSITIEMGIINYIEKEKLLDAFFPELMSEVVETTVGPWANNKEKEIRHDVKVLAKVRLGSYFDSRKDIED